jgi:muramidase (phage lysozyme)
MDALPVIGIVAMLAAIAWYGSRDSAIDKSSDPSGWDFGPFLPNEDDMSTQIISSSQSPEKNRAAFLALIRKFEAAGRYDVMYGWPSPGRVIMKFNDHPRKFWPINLPGYEGQFSSAAGAYQFNVATWDEQRRRTPVPDFSPSSQDIMALGLLDHDGALQYIDVGDFDTAMRVASKRWASLPYSGAGQNPQTVASANAFLQSMIG